MRSGKRATQSLWLIGLLVFGFSAGTASASWNGDGSGVISASDGTDEGVAPDSQIFPQAFSSLTPSFSAIQSWATPGDITSTQVSSSVFVLIASALHDFSTGATGTIGGRCRTSVWVLLAAVALASGGVTGSRIASHKAPPQEWISWTAMVAGAVILLFSSGLWPRVFLSSVDSLTGYTSAPSGAGSSGSTTQSDTLDFYCQTRSATLEATAEGGVRTSAAVVGALLKMEGTDVDSAALLARYQGVFDRAFSQVSVAASSSSSSSFSPSESTSTPQETAKAVATAARAAASDPSAMQQAAATIYGRLYDYGFSSVREQVRSDIDMKSATGSLAPMIYTSGYLAPDGPGQNMVLEVSQAMRWLPQPSMGKENNLLQIALNGTLGYIVVGVWMIPLSCASGAIWLASAGLFGSPVTIIKGIVVVVLSQTVAAVLAVYLATAALNSLTATASTGSTSVFSLTSWIAGVDQSLYIWILALTSIPTVAAVLVTGGLALGDWYAGKASGAGGTSGPSTAGSWLTGGHSGGGGSTPSSGAGEHGRRHSDGSTTGQTTPSAGFNPPPRNPARRQTD
ncbi:hypothetical protein [Verrucomicrobium sp. GAS474]|uniref:hypothetical protein n=1 Tax=Verrucomicrobium sp. GAS474 TaxID=1882831 RepID=UPI0012FF6D08|nr:hypothetical protein [Verrucomicrobium sp. GAS474]